jgi:hypothetical protein
VARQAGRRSRLPSANWTPKILGRMPELNVSPSGLPSAKSTAKVPPFSMRGVPAIAANPREGSRLLRFRVKVPNTSSEIGTTLSRARACGRMQTVRPEVCAPRFSGSSLRRRNSMLFRPAFHSQNQQQRDLRRNSCLALRLGRLPQRPLAAISEPGGAAARAGARASPRSERRLPVPRALWREWRALGGLNSTGVRMVAGNFIASPSIVGKSSHANRSAWWTRSRRMGEAEYRDR